MARCYTDNDASLALIQNSDLTPNNCEHIPLRYGLSVWVDKNTVQCVNALNAFDKGLDGCFQRNFEGEWLSRSSYINPDQPLFRTLGENLAVNDSEDPKYAGGSVTEEDIQCLAADNKTVRSGSDKCWPYWIQGASVIVGSDGSGNDITADTFVWLTNEGIECTSNGETVTGLDNCKIDSDNLIQCSATRLTNLDLNSNDVCIPTFAWKSKL